MPLFTLKAAMNETTDITSDNVKTTYQFYAPIYNFLFGAVLAPGRRALSKEVSMLKPTHILEIGVGTGLLLKEYPAASMVTGIDVSEDMLKVAYREVERLKRSSINLVVMDAENLEFPDNSFDCVVLPYVLSVTPNPDKLIAEARRVCKKNSTIIIVNHFSGNGFWWFLEKAVKNISQKIGFRSDFSYAENVLSHDWTILRVQSVNIFGLSKIVVIAN